MTDPATLLPPNATKAERALEMAAARIADVPVPLLELWSPDDCPVEILPWLAWQLSIDRWDPAWSEEQKRVETARAIELQRTKGTPASVDAVLTSWDPALSMVEWWEEGGSGVPYTFDITIPIEPGGGDITTGAFAQGVIRDVTRYKPLRAHFGFIQLLNAHATIAPIGGATITRFQRFEATAFDNDSYAWAYLETEDGDPLLAEDGSFLGL
ncbi:MAG: hypothetical protein JWQ16_1759 [Novosphingobium sp.]|nr:hypothetical protein [Novosphingobium sp.]